MEHRIAATQLARNLGDVLARIRYRGESFVVERNGGAVARIGPVMPAKTASLRDVVESWFAAGADSTFSRDLEAVNSADAPATNPWA